MPQTNHWQHPIEAIEPNDDFDKVAMLSEMLHSLLAFIGDGRKSGTMEARAWAAIKVIRADIIDDETFREAAERMNVARSVLCDLVEECRIMLKLMKEGHPAPRSFTKELQRAHRRLFATTSSPTLPAPTPR